MAKSYLHLSSVFPIGMRRNNPGNLAKSKTVYAGLTDRPDTGRGPLFFAFVDMPHGIRAMIALLTNYVTSRGLNTITKLAYHYAPPKAGNDTKLWIRQVSAYAGLPATQVLTADPETIRVLVLAIIQKEVGLKWQRGGFTATITTKDYDDALALSIS